MKHYYVSFMYYSRLRDETEEVHKQLIKAKDETSAKRMARRIHSGFAFPDAVTAYIISKSGQLLFHREYDAPRWSRVD